MGNTLESDGCSEELHHYASCNDCSLYKWAETSEEAREFADAHEELFTSHSAYTGATGVIR